MTQWQLIGRCLLPAFAVVGFLVGLPFSRGMSLEKTVTIVLLTGIIIFVLLTITIFISSTFDKIKSGDPYKKFLGLYNLTLFPLVMMSMYAFLYKNFGLNHNGEAVKDTRDFIYFSVITWTTTGYGDLTPSPDSRLFAASEALLGYIFMGLYLAVIFHVISAPAGQTRSDADSIQ